jgi:hypothetical protein
MPWRHIALSGIGLKRFAQRALVRQTAPQAGKRMLITVSLASTIKATGTAAYLDVFCLTHKVLEALSHNVVVRRGTFQNQPNNHAWKDPMTPNRK